MSQIRICDIHAGKPDAKEDITRNKQEFLQTYQPPPNLNEKSLLTGDVCYIVGNKGFGKTATLRYLNECFLKQNPATISTFIHFERDYTHQVKSRMESVASQSFVTYGLEDLDEDEEVDKLDFSLVWRWHLFLTIVRDNKNGKIFFKDNNWKRFERFVTGIFKKEIVATVSGSFDLNLPDGIPSLFKFIQPHISIELPELNIGRKEYTFPEAMENAQECFIQLKDNRGVTPYYIFVDELDIHYGDEKGYLRDLRLVHDLALEVKELNDMILKLGWHQNTKVFCTLRPEVLQAIEEKLPARSLKRAMDGYRFDLSWTSDSSETYTLPIMKLFLKRIEVAETKFGVASGSDIETYERWFPDQIEGMEASHYIRQITWSRPRDIVRLLTVAKMQRPNDTAFTKYVFEDLMRDYSKGSKEELRGELETSYPPSEIEDIFRCFVLLPERFTLEEFQTRLEKLGWKEEPGHDVISILGDLYRVGAIGQAFGDEETWYYQGEPYTPDLDNIVHQGLIRALRVIAKKKDTVVDIDQKSQEEERKKKEIERRRQEEKRKRQEEEEQRRQEEKKREEEQRRQEEQKIEKLSKGDKPGFSLFSKLEERFLRGETKEKETKRVIIPWTGNPENVGEIVTFGRYPQEGGNGKPAGIEWIVLDVKDGKSLLISRYALEVKAYHEKGKRVTWETCTLRRWLNQGFIQKAFTQDEQQALVRSTVKNPDNPIYGTKGGNDTKDEVFLLSIEEAEQYFPSFEARTCFPTRYALSKNGEIMDKDYGAGCLWWLRSPGYGNNDAADVWPDGSLLGRGCSVDTSSIAVRPALWLQFSS